MDSVKSVRVGAAAALRVVGVAPGQRRVARRTRIAVRNTERLTATGDATRPTRPSETRVRRRDAAAHGDARFSESSARRGAGREAVLLSDAWPEGWPAFAGSTAGRAALIGHVLALVATRAAVLPIARRVRAAHAARTRAASTCASVSCAAANRTAADRAAASRTAADRAAANRTAASRTASLTSSTSAAGAADALVAAHSCHRILAGSAVAGSSCSGATARPVDLASTVPARESLVAGTVWIASAGLCTRRTAFAAAAAGAARGKRRHQGQEHERVSEHHFSSAPQASHGRARRTSAPRLGSRTCGRK